MLNMSSINEEKIEDNRNKTLEATETYLPKRHTDREYLKAIDRIAPCDLRETVGCFNDTVEDTSQHISSLEAKGQIKKFEPYLRHTGGTKYGRTRLFGSIFAKPQSRYLIINPSNPYHWNKLADRIIDSIPGNISKGEKAATTHQLKEMHNAGDLPEDVYNRIRASYMRRVTTINLDDIKKYIHSANVRVWKVEDKDKWELRILCRDVDSVTMNHYDTKDKTLHLSFNFFNDVGIQKGFNLLIPARTKRVVVD